MNETDDIEHSEKNYNREDEVEEQFQLDKSDNGTMFTLSNQRIDYECRSMNLENMCLYDYISSLRKKKQECIR